MHNTRFDFALSFSGADRSIARKIYDTLIEENFKVFIDEKFEHEMIGKDGTLYLMEIYSKQSCFCIVLISPEYDSGSWTQLERESIQARELAGERGVLIPVKLSAYSPQWLPATRIYFDLSSRPIIDLMKIIRAKYQCAREYLSFSPADELKSSVNIAGTWESNENIGKLVMRKGTMRIDQDGVNLSGSAILVEHHPDGNSIEFELELHGEVDAKTNVVRFIGSLLHVFGGRSNWPYSVDSFTGRIVNANQIIGSCMDERGIRGELRLRRIASKPIG